MIFGEVVQGISGNPTTAHSINQSLLSVPMQEAIARVILPVDARAGNGAAITTETASLEYTATAA